MEDVVTPDSIKIGAVIPTYNRGHLIERAIESALRQSHMPIEIIVVDDGSSDDTSQRVAQFGLPVRYIYQENSGSAVARNHGVGAAQADWIAFLDSDDLWEEDHLLRMAQAIAGTFGRANYYFADSLQPEEEGAGLLWSQVGFSIDDSYKFYPDGTELVLVRGKQPIMLQSTVVNRNAFQKCGGFRKELRYRDDTHIFLKLGLGQPICAVAGCGVIMTADDLPENRLTLTYDDTESGIYMFTIMYEDLLQDSENLSPATIDELRRRFGNSLRNMARRSWEKGEYTQAANYLTRALTLDPKRQIQEVLSRI